MRGYQRGFTAALSEALRWATNASAGPTRLRATLIAPNQCPVSGIGIAAYDDNSYDQTLTLGAPFEEGSFSDEYDPCPVGMTPPTSKRSASNSAFTFDCNSVMATCVSARPAQMRRASDAGKTKAVFLANGETIPDEPDIPITPPVTAAPVNRTTGVCMGTTFPAPLKNEKGMFKAVVQ